MWNSAYNCVLQAEDSWLREFHLSNWQFSTLNSNYWCWYWKKIKSKQLSQHFASPFLRLNLNPASIFPPSQSHLPLFGQTLQCDVGGHRSSGSVSISSALCFLLFFFHWSLALTAPLPWCRTLHLFRRVLPQCEGLQLWSQHCSLPHCSPTLPLFSSGRSIHFFLPVSPPSMASSQQGTMLPNPVAAAPWTVLWN